ncbi:MAG: F0F1 ATP synthase subunit A [Oscillospiraceae bacterium]|nr:F0F1 ATP synthase subunit A [Oscillospiraceae bacterium]
MGERITEELEVASVFDIRLGGLTIHVSETVVVMWIIMAIMIIGGFLLTRRLRVENPSKRQVAVEGIYSWLDKFFRDIVGEKGGWMVSYLVIVITFLVISNLFGIFGFKAPTKDLQLTGILAVFSIVLVQVASVKAHGVGGWLKSFTNPMNALELVIKPLSLCMRLFGNILGAFVIMKSIEYALPIIAPPVVSLYFDLFDGALQAYVFTFLTALYIQEAVE